MDETRAAAVIQSCFRGYKARKLYNLESLRKDKADRKEQHVLESEVLNERHAAENTPRPRNELWRLNVMAIRIQRAWRAHQQKTSDDAETILPEIVTNSYPSHSADNENPLPVTELEHLVRQVESVLPGEGDEFEEMFEYPTDAFTECKGWSDRSSDPMIGDVLMVEHETAAENAPLNSLEDVYPCPNIPCGSDAIQHCSSENTQVLPTHDTSSGDVQLAKSDDKAPVNVLGKYHLLYSVELSESSEEELHSNQHMTTKLNATCQDTPQDLKTFEEVSITDLQLVRTPPFCHNLSRFPNYYFEGSEEFAYSEDFQTRHEFNHTAAYERSRTGSGHIGRAFDHGFSPLFGMSVLQLKQLLLSLKTRIEGTSLVLVELLEERDSLKAENELLQANIAQLARNVQDLYSPRKNTSSNL